MSLMDGNTETRKHRNTVLGLAVITAVVLAWFSPWWAGGRVLAPLDILNQMMEPWRAVSEEVTVKNHMVSDSVSQYLGYRLLAEDQFRTEGRVGWSSLTYGGTAAYANTMALYDDWTMQLHRWFDFWTAWHLGLIGQVLLAGYGMLVFLRGRGIAVCWGITGALAYAANSQFVTWINHRWALGSFCWLPWIFFALDRWRGGHRWWGWAVPCFIALAFLGGTLQHSALIALAVVVYALTESSGGGWKPRLRVLPKYALFGLAGSGLAAFSLIPCAAAFLVTQKLGIHFGLTDGIEESWYREGPWQPVFNMAAYPLQVFPSLFGGTDSVDLLKLFKSELFYVAYFGSLPVLVAFFRPWSRRCPPLARWLILLGLVLPLTPLVRPLYQRLFSLFIFGGVLAFADFMQRADGSERRAWFKRMVWVGSVALLGWMLVSVALQFVGSGVLEKLHAEILSRSGGSSFGYFRKWWEARADRFVGRLFVWDAWHFVPLVCLVAGVVGFRFTASNLVGRRNLGRLLVISAVVIEVSVFAGRWVTWADPSATPLYAETAETVELRRVLGRDGRVKVLSDANAHLAKTPFVQNTLTPFGIATLGGYDSIVPDGMEMPGDQGYDATVLARKGVTHLVTSGGFTVTDPDWRKVWSSESTAIYENEQIAPKYAGFTSRSGLDKFLVGEAGPAPESVWESSRLENSRRMDVPSGVRWIRLAENWDEGWEWRVEGGRWGPVTRASDGSMILALENDLRMEAPHIEMRFRPRLREWGWIITGMTFGVMAVMATISLGLSWLRRAMRIETNENRVATS